MSENYDRYEAPISLSDIMLKVVLVLFVLYLAASLASKKSNEAANVQKKAEFVITAEWDKENRSEVDCDVDLWVRDPDGDSVYFNSKDGNGLHLERDDLGDRNDVIKNSFGDDVTGLTEDKEYAYIRSILPGEYVVNVHLYGCKKGSTYSTSPLNAPPGGLQVEVQFIKLNPRMTTVDVEVVRLDRIWQEETAMNVTLDSKGDVRNVARIPTKLIKSTNTQAGPLSR